MTRMPVIYQNNANMSNLDLLQQEFQQTGEGLKMKFAIFVLDGSNNI